MPYAGKSQWAVQTWGVPRHTHDDVDYRAKTPEMSADKPLPSAQTAQTGGTALAIKLGWYAVASAHVPLLVVLFYKPQATSFEPSTNCLLLY